MARIRARNPLNSFGISMLGPALLKYGNEAQKKEHLPKIARGEIRWCQGYSEPNAGSDLASLATSAEDKGDHFLVNGQKIWTSYADKADWIFCLVRTDKSNKHNGISFVLFDMKTPGVSTKPILLISGYSPFCETFFDNVKVPKENLVGELNKGWDVAKYLLGHEREMISGMGLGGTGGKNPLVLGALATIGVDHDGKLADPLLRAQIALFEVRAKAFAAQSERFIDELKAGRAHPAQPSMMKYYGTELNKSRYELVMAAGGSDELEWESEASNGGREARAWLRTKANSIEGGTSEVQLNIIAKRILELPS
jgi:acyl-CoA dehydrogenase